MHKSVSTKKLSGKLFHMILHYGYFTDKKFVPKTKIVKKIKKTSLMNNTHFGTIHYDIYLDLKLDYTISRFFQETVTSRIRNTTSLM